MPTSTILSPSPAPLARAARLPDMVVAIVLALLVGLLFLALNPLSDVPMNDDFSWARSAKAFADTGKIVYNGWGNPILLPHIIVGGLLIKLFGFSHIILSAFGIFSGMAFTGSVYLLARACGVRRSLSLFATALTVLNPVFLGCTPSFMSDVPSAFLYTCALLAFVKSAYRPEGETRYALRPIPLGFAVVLAFLAGANRQILWASLLVAFVAAFFYLAPSERMKKLLPALVIIVVGAVALQSWFAAQPYTVVVSLENIPFYWEKAPDLIFWNPYKFIALTALAALPVTLPILVLRWRTAPRPIPLLLICFTVGIVPLLTFFVQPNASRELWNGRWGLTAYGQYASSQGIMIGGVHGYENRPLMIPLGVGILLHIVSAVGIGILLWVIFATVKKRTLASSVLLIGALSQIILPLPWFASGASFDRYLLTLVPGLLIALLPGDLETVVASQETVLQSEKRAYLLGLPLAAIYAFSGLLFAQEYFASTQARAKLYQKLRAQNTPQFIDAGVETSGDTQIALEKFINNKNIKIPASAFQESRQGNCSYAPIYFPAMDAHYVFSLVYPAPDLSNVGSRDPLPLEAEPVDKMEYYSIVAPHKRTIYTYRVTRP